MQDMVSNNSNIAIVFFKNVYHKYICIYYNYYNHYELLF